MTEFTSIGKPTRLIDGRAKVTGTLRFAPDLYLPGMLYARFVPSAHAHATIRSVEKSAALAVPGVVAVLTADDLPNIPPSSRNLLLLARGRVIFVGQPVALVLADNEAAAEDGVDQVMVDYEVLPSAITMDEALAEGAPLVWPKGVPQDRGDAGAHGTDVTEEEEGDHKPSNIGHHGSMSRGDVVAGFAEAAAVVEFTYTTPMVHQSSLEPQGCVVQPDPITGGAAVWSSTQSPFDVRKDVASVLGVPESDVRVTGMPVGGGFGAKGALYDPLAALAAKIIGRPVRLTLTRMEELSAANPAPPVRIEAKLGAKSDGTLTALEAKVMLDSGCYPDGLSGFLAFMLASFYRIPNFRIDHTNVMTFKQSDGAYRAPGAPSVIFAIDGLVDALARKLDIDPLEMRLKNIARPGDPMANDRAWPGMGAAETLEALRDHPAWQNREAAHRAGRGVGIAIGGWMGGVQPAAAACSMNRDGLIHVHIGSADISGTTTGFTLLAAEAFGVSPESVRIIASDTNSAPYSGFSGGSKVTYVTGAAVVKAAQEARRQALAIAAEEFEAAIEDLEIVDGAVQVRGMPTKSIKLGQIAKKTMDFGGRYAPILAHGNTAITAQAPGFSAQLAEVEVDQETGVVHLHRLVVAQDVGKAINPLAVEGQMMGGAVQGVGWALYEKMVYDENGQLMTGSFMDYAIPDFTQAPAKIETIIVEVPSENGPFGARGVGEPPVVPTAAAIANAVADATGVRMTDLPMSAPDVLAALQRANGA